MKVPVVALTGHLGAGKTSLLNHLLRRPGARLGVVVNDFGVINVDAALVLGQVDDAAAISGGCLCCLPDAGGLDEALERLARPRLRLDAILVEASGVADPRTVDRLIRFSGAEHVRPGGVVEVVDAVEHGRTVGADAGALVDLLEQPPTGAFRPKGCVPVRTASGSRRYVVNLVGRHIHVATAPAARPSPGRAHPDRLVAIGTDLDEGLVRDRLGRALEPARTCDSAGLRRLQRHRRLSP